MSVQMSAKLRASFRPQYIGNQDNKLLAHVVYFAEPVKTSLWAFWVEQDTQYTCFLPQTSQDRNECTTTWLREAKNLLYTIYTELPTHLTHFFLWYVLTPALNPPHDRALMHSGTYIYRSSRRYNLHF